MKASEVVNENTEEERRARHYLINQVLYFGCLF